MERYGTYLRRVTQGAGPAWAVSVETTASGETLFRNQTGAQLVALAVTRAELDLLVACLPLQATDDACSPLRNKFRRLRNEVN